MLWLLLAGDITIKEEIHFYCRSVTEKYYVEDHGSDAEMTITETNVDIEIEIILLSDFSQSVMFRS